MLFRRQTLEGLARGEIDLAFRRWKRAGAKTGGSTSTALGVVRFGEVMIVDPGSLTEHDAKRSGFVGLAALREMLGPDDGNPVYRIALLDIGADERVTLRDDKELAQADRQQLKARFARWERDRPGYFPGILRAITAQPGVAAAKLAADARTEKLKFKQDVRKLKELGLTESLETGYRISARGKAVLDWLEAAK